MNFFHKHIHAHVRKYKQHYTYGVSILTFLAVLLISIGYIRNSLAATSGPNSPAAAVDNSSTGSIAWATPGNVISSNNSYATVTLTDNGTTGEISHYLIATGFAFAIPTGATINGITVEVEKKAGNASRIADYAVRIIKGGVITGTNKAIVGFWDTAEVYSGYGSASDLWGITGWAYTDINNANFGVAFSAFKNTTAGGNTTVSVDHIRITIAYTPETTPPSVTLISPASGATLSGSTLFTWSGYDNVAISGYTFKVFNSGGTAIYSLQLTTTGTSFNTGDGNYSWNVIATDTAGNTGTATNRPFTFSTIVIDTTPPILAQVTAVPSPTNDTTPDYTFSSNEAGTITYSGDCSSATTGAISGNNTVIFTTLSEGLHTGCLIRVKDAANNTSVPLSVNTFTIDTTSPTASAVTYDTTGWTNGNVTATVTGFSESITGINASNHLFTSNGSFVFTFQDLAGNPGSATGTVTWIDKTVPVVTLSGPSTMTIYINNIYPEYGATWTDNVDAGGFLTGPSAGSVNTSALGIYVLTYGVYDSVGNYGSGIRTVTITGSTPVVSLNGLNPYNIEFGSGYTEYGATRTDTADGSGVVTDIVSSVNLSLLGSYTVTYTKVNTSLITGTAVRTVNVKDSVAPVLTLNGSGTVHVEYGSNYTEDGATWTDNYDGGPSSAGITISGSVNTGVLNTYILTYIHADTSNNTGTTTRTVIVEDTVPPSVILLASNSSPTNTAIHMTAQFSEAVTGFTSTDITLGNGSLSGFVKVDADTYTFDVNPSSQGTETVDIASGVCKDLAAKDNITALQFSIIYDTVAPSITITSHASGQLISGTGVALVGTSTDTNDIASIKVNGIIANGTGSWNKSVSLNGGNNVIPIEAADNAGNTGTASITLIRVPVTSNVSNSFVSSTSQEITFNTDFSSLGYVRYGIGNFGSGALGTLGIAHSITISNLNINTTYLYQVAGIINGSTGEFSATGSFYKSQVVTSSGTTVATGGSVVISGAFTTGTVILSSGSNTVEIHLSGTYNSLEFVAPTIVLSSNTGTAEFGESGLPASTSGTTIRVILGTHKVGGNVGVAVSAYITFQVSNGTVGQTLLLYRSENGSTWIVNTPDASCTLDSSLNCSFWTDSLSYFATISETASSVASAKGGSNLVSPDDCPQYGDLSPSYYDGTCAFHGAPSKLPEEMHMAFMYARQIGLTNSKNIESANIDGDLTRAKLAKIMTIYATKVLHKKLDQSLKCEFTDLKGQARLAKQYIKYACQLGLMGYTIDGSASPTFNPNGKITRADLGTILSRALYGTQTYIAHGSAPYYQDHLNALKENGIMRDIRPTFKESIGTAMLMFMRATANK